MKYLIDTNVFLQAALEQGKESRCREFLDKVSSGEIEAFASFFHLDSAAVIMENRGMEKKDISNFYFEAYSSEGLDIVSLGVSSRLNALADKNHSGLDDGLISQGLKELEAEKIVTYDSDFDEKIRIKPEEVLNDTM